MSATAMTRRRITQQQLATSLGLSKATVSLALNDSPLVARHTRRRVLQDNAAELYRIPLPD